MKTRLFLAILFVTAMLAAAGCNVASQAQSVAGAIQPLITITDSQLRSSPVVISYGDMRFTDPSETEASNPKVRRWLVERIAAEKPNALLLSGDVPFHGGVGNDWEVFDAETAPWKVAGIRVFPALGNHELYLKGIPGSKASEPCVYDQPCLDNWWSRFPQLRGVRWYSVQIGSRMLVLNLDSNLSLEPGSDQTKWIRAQLASLPVTVRFVFFNMHHPPVADPPAQANAPADGRCSDTVSPRCNEIALADFLKSAPESKLVRFVVVGGHVHNYERFLRDGIVYLVSGGGGALPYAVKREPDDLYQDSAFPNYHYLKFVLREDRIDAEMIRVSDPLADSPGWDVKDRFQVK